MHCSHAHWVRVQLIACVWRKRETRKLCSFGDPDRAIGSGGLVVSQMSGVAFSLRPFPFSRYRRLYDMTLSCISWIAVLRIMSKQAKSRTSGTLATLCFLVPGLVVLRSLLYGHGRHDGEPVNGGA